MKKSRLIAVLIIAAMAFTAIPTRAVISNPPGVSDAVEILKHVVGLGSVYDNSDFEPTIEDAVEILKYVVGLSDGDSEVFGMVLFVNSDSDVVIDFRGDSVVIALSMEATWSDNKDYTTEEFKDIGAVGVTDILRLSDREWELVQNGRANETLVNPSNFRRSMIIRLDKNCKENVLQVIQQLEQLEWIYYAIPNYVYNGSVL
ncbi:MAG: hypothetical protein LBC71_08230 [Oscillospiraceae bacterium]|jgi:hypothetical protein|nr:hypothetical protein [Oscillospiraceae bacterium]